MTKALHGLLLLNKPPHLTSHDVVKQVRKITGMKEVGHTGTLDPLASGLMVLVLGEATKLSEHLLTGEKGYRVRIQLGLETNSWDTDGETIRKDTVSFTYEQLQRAVASLEGEFSWPVPLFSAAKKDGQKLYEIAHAGGNMKHADLPRKPMRFSSVRLLEATRDEALCDFRCSKGSFVRTWGMELGAKLGTAGTVTALTRIYSAPYELGQAVELEEIQNLPIDQIATLKAFIPIHQTLPDWPALTLKGRELRLMTHGQVPFEVERRLIYQQKQVNRSGQSQGVKVYNAETGGFLAVLELRPCAPIRIKRIFKTVSKTP